MENKLKFLVLGYLTLLLNSSAFSQSATPGPGFGFMQLIPLIIIIVVIIAVVSSSKNKKDENTSISSDQTNKVVNVNLTGGLIGLFSSSPQNTLNTRINQENNKGWRVIQVIPADSGNVFLFIFRLLLLVFTLFLFTTANGYYVVLERNTSKDDVPPK